MKLGLWLLQGFFCLPLTGKLGLQCSAASSRMPKDDSVLARCNWPQELHCGIKILPTIRISPLCPSVKHSCLAASWFLSAPGRKSRLKVRLLRPALQLEPWPCAAGSKASRPSPARRKRYPVPCRSGCPDSALPSPCHFPRWTVCFSLQVEHYICM